MILLGVSLPLTRPLREPIACAPPSPPDPEPGDGYLALEQGGYLLLEQGGRLLLE